MTETPNTAAIRAAWGSYDYHVPTPWEKVAELCDALDAARAERDNLQTTVDEDLIYIRRQEARAEAAEAEATAANESYRKLFVHCRDVRIEKEAAEARADVFLANLRGAEARIAAALAVYGSGLGRAAMHRALTEGTGQ